MGKRRTDRWIAVLGLLGLILFIFFSMGDELTGGNDRISREEAVAKAEALYAAQGFTRDGMKVTATLDGDADTDGYLGRHDLRDAFYQVMPRTAPLVYWSVTFSSRDISYASVSVRLDAQTGDVVAFASHGMVRTVQTEEASAQEIATRGLMQMGIDPSALERRMELEVPGASAELFRDQRSVLDEHTRRFVYEQKAWHVGELKLRYVIDVANDRVTALRYSYSVPSDFFTWHAEQQKIGTILTMISLGLSFVIFACAFVYAFLLKGERPWWSTFWLTLTVLILFFFANLNQLPVFEQSVLEGGGGGLELLLVGAFAIVGVAVLSVIVAAATYPTILSGGMLVREVDPRLWIPRRDPEWSASVRQAVWYGYGLALAWLGFQSVFYWLAQTYFGVWYENDFTMSPVNMLFPLLFPLLGWLAGIQEEAFYRLFGVTFLKRYVKSSFVAVLLPAMVWALGHSLYPIYPIYTRFIELTIFGVIIGFCYLRFGFVTVVFAHVIFDVIQMSLPLLFGKDGMEMASGGFFLVLPIFVGYGISYLLSKRATFLENRGAS
ncbi:CPBP family intramembrane metalloprotease [Tumebacillus sp. DT12]|uniref:CPBP family intramembrane metalloprotease n=1 Tax=Tumebacillus lacus TaxID=2995335 RepID=A0ABT3WXW7_9BACL|nr:CPBP family intramembrane glutamic endopeptidase [Tumebacillus lacus]MCX7569505.1 CPBP family intramembrane metalloprotease [Tumebacillus lacus]